MVEYKRCCNFCKATFSAEDEEMNFGIDMILPYGSDHDMAHIRVDLCIPCLNKLFDDYIIPNCQINPLVEVLDEEEIDWDEYE